MNNQRTGQYIVIESATVGFDLSKVKVKTIYDTVKHILPSGFVRGSQQKDNSILIVANSSQEAEKAVGEHQFDSTNKIRIVKHKTLNYVKGVISYRHLLTDSVDDLKDLLKNQKVVEVERIKRFENGVLTDTLAHVLAFDLYHLPERVKIGFLSLPVRPYYPNSMRCRKC